MLVAEEQQAAFGLFDLTQQEADARADAVQLANALFPGLRELAAAFEVSVPVFRDHWYSASTETHRNTVIFARYLHDALLPAAQTFYREHATQFSPELGRTYRQDLRGFARAVQAYYDVAIQKGAEEMERAATLSAFVLAQPGLRENVKRMRLEYEEGKRTKFSDTGLSQERD